MHGPGKCLSIKRSPSQNWKGISDLIWGSYGDNLYLKLRNFHLKTNLQVVCVPFR